MSRRLTSYEQEIIINFNNAENVAHIFTYEKSWQKHFEKLLGLKSTFDNSFGGKEYQIDKKGIPCREVIEDYLILLRKNSSRGCKETEF